MQVFVVVVAFVFEYSYMSWTFFVTQYFACRTPIEWIVFP